MKQWTVQDVMTNDVITVAVDTPYHELVSLFATHHISAAPVLDGAGQIVGVVSEADLLHKVEFADADSEPRMFEWGSRKAGRAKARGAVAQDLMTAPPVTADADLPLAKAAQRMDKARVKRLPVVDENGHPIGLVSRGDLLKVYLRADADLRDDIVDGVLRRVLWIEPETIAVDVHDGDVTLTGEVGRKSTAMILNHVTRGVPGVVSVEDRVTWEYDDTLAAAVGGM